METSLHDHIIQRCQQDREKGLTASILKDLKDSGHQLTLVSVFYSDVFIGGFERFVYNANGVYLPEVAEVLEALNAGHATKYLDIMMQYCIDETEAYQAFLASDFSDCIFKTALADISARYTKTGPSLIDEIPDSLKKLLRQR